MGRLSAVVLAGGTGTRLWPLSRELYPKQFFSPDGNGSLLHETIGRLDAFGPDIAYSVVTHEDYRFLIAEELRASGKQGTILVEPCARNTAPAITFAALVAHANDPGAMLLVLPCDHVIREREKFHATVQAALPAAAAGKLVLFGVAPTRSETAYGYVRRGEAENGLFAVDAFIEKPDMSAAMAYANNGSYYWNSGMFLFRADACLEEMERHAPDILAAVRESWQQARTDVDFVRPGRDAFGGCRSESIDYAVMEKTDRAVLAPLDVGWSDVGSWTALAQVNAPDARGNVFHGDVVAVNTRNTIVHAEDRLVATLGVSDHVIVETSDAVLVAAKDRVQDVGKIVHQLKRAGRREVTEHRRVHRPWGYYERILDGRNFQVKKLCVKPAGRLSLQMHHHRTEHWVVVAGTARVTNGDDTFLLAEDESTFIRKGCRHRLENPGRITLEVIEVQSGAYLGEDDIVRFEDTYGRIPH